MHSPYTDLEERAFWRSAVGARSALDTGDLYRAKFSISRRAKIATAGSCFAQHVGRSLRSAGLNVLDEEPVPGSIPDSEAQRYGYRLYSARYGNIYTTRQLLQLHKEAYGEISPESAVWEKDSRFYDAMRPSVEPNGLKTPELVAQHRQAHLAAVRDVYETADVVVFTFGLTEAWEHTKSKTVYPTAPGTIAGSYDANTFNFVNLDYNAIMRDFVEFRKRIKAIKKSVKFVITVSPVPLTATATGQHVEVATAYSKSVLRAVCGSLYERFSDVDYFPSYEIITSTNNRGAYFENNKRSVSTKGVQTAMGMFLGAHGFAGEPAQKSPAASSVPVRIAPPISAESNDVVCEDELLEAFSK